ncbi:MAG: DUF3109 family protein [Muribaculaceae bacterium]|jgi:Fe-S-cluster containining protein|nr:DUF3109 family protein [Muribaculaceae bacterium]MBQ2235998.1 DUF3109 family protein [Muribaculaceae bacterium]
MLDIQGTLVSLDLVERFFCCDLESCLGACCIEGDAGAPITKDEYELLKKILPTVWDDLLPRAQEEIAAHGVAYVDQEGDLVTNIIDGKNCVFTCYEPGGLCSCAIERAYRNGRIAWRKPLSCFLYPVRVKRLTDGTFAVNYDRWKICKCAEVLGRKEGLRVYQFLKEPLIERFGQAWYDELALTCEQYLKQFGD